MPRARPGASGYRPAVERHLDELERRDSAAAAALAEVEAEADQVAAESEAVQREAESTAVRLAAVPRLTQPGPPEDVEAWAARARGALLVLHGALAAERDAIVREANELGSALLGEALGAVSVANVRERLARTLPGGPP